MEKVTFELTPYDAHRLLSLLERTFNLYGPGFYPEVSIGLHENISTQLHDQQVIVQTK